MGVQSLPQELEAMLQKDFGFPLKNRLHVAAEVKMYRKGEDEGIWNQAKNEQFEYQVYFDGQFICYLSINESKKGAYYKALKGIFEAYKDKKIYFNQRMYTEEDDLLKDKKRSDDQSNRLLNPKTEDDKFFAEVFKKVGEEKKRDKAGSPLVLPNGIIVE